jgi:hypothetical protein
MKKYVTAILIVIIIFFCVVSIWAYFTDFLQNLGVSYSVSNFLGYIFILILSALIYFFFEYMEKENKKTIQKLLTLSTLINDFDYNNLNNIKKIYIFDDSNFKIVLKDNNDTTLNFNIKNLPQTQQELVLLDTNIIIKK